MRETVFLYPVIVGAKPNCNEGQLSELGGTE